MGSAGRCVTRRGPSARAPIPTFPRRRGRSTAWLLRFDFGWLARSEQPPRSAPSPARGEGLGWGPASPGARLRRVPHPDRPRSGGEGAGRGSFTAAVRPPIHIAVPVHIAVPIPSAPSPARGGGLGRGASRSLRHPARLRRVPPSRPSPRRRGKGQGAALSLCLVMASPNPHRRPDPLPPRSRGRAGVGARRSLRHPARAFGA